MNELVRGVEVIGVEGNKNGHIQNDEVDVGDVRIGIVIMLLSD